MNRIWSLGLMWLLVATVGGLFVGAAFPTGNRDRLANPIESSSLQVQAKAIERRVTDVPEPPEVIARVQKIIDSVVEEIERPMGVWFVARCR